MPPTHNGGTGLGQWLYSGSESRKCHQSKAAVKSSQANSIRFQGLGTTLHGS